MKTRHSSRVFAWLALTGGLFLSLRGVRADSRLEALLANPPASGLLIVQTVRNSMAAEQGLREGDILLKYAGTALTTVEHLKSLVEKHEKSKGVEVEILREGKSLKLKLGSGPLGVRTARLEKGKPKWKPAPPASYAPDISGLRGETWMIFLLNNKRTGFERRTFRARADGLESEYRIAFAGSGFDERYRATLQTGKAGPLSFRSLRFVSGPRQNFVVEARRDGARIVGTRLGKKESIAAPADALPSYGVAELAATLPLKVGFRLPFHVFEEADFRIQSGHELICRARETVRIGGKAIEAWLYEDQQYGEPGNQYWIDARRRLVKATWGNLAATGLTTREEALRGLPARLASFASEGYPGQ